MSTMPSLRKTAEGVGHVEIQDVPVPDIGPDEVLMKVYAAGICGSDDLQRQAGTGRALSNSNN